ncbi:hypothetical protein PtB15_13B337 [Puccinia triticina]|nr:hypothetical protein PtB15_13B337 [Puccinia triticina]
MGSPAYPPNNFTHSYSTPYRTGKFPSHAAPSLGTDYNDLRRFALDPGTSLARHSLFVHNYQTGNFPTRAPSLGTDDNY